jgi:hypothetical protein
MFAQFFSRGQDHGRHILCFVELGGELFRLLDGSSDPSVKEIRGQGHKALTRQPVAEIPKEVVQPPPGMKDENPCSWVGFGYSKIAVV